MRPPAASYSSVEHRSCAGTAGVAASQVLRLCRRAIVTACLNQKVETKMHVRARCVSWVVGAVVLLMAGAEGQYVTNKWISGNLPGDVLVLSVNRAPFTDGTRVNGVSNIVRTAQDCQDQCNFVSGCQGWTFCGKAGGCGTGCKDYHAKNGPGFSGLALGCTPVGARMPINYDQTYGPSRSNLKDFKPDPTVCTGDAWPQYTCTLKTNITSLKVYSGNQAGWQSGVVILAPPCRPPSGVAPMTAWECDTCLKSADPQSCLTCSNQLYTNPNTCGYTRSAYWARPKATYVKYLTNQNCLACTCYSKPSDAAARSRCFDVTKSIGVYGSPYYNSWYKELEKAAALCPKA